MKDENPRKDPMGGIPVPVSVVLAERSLSVDQILDLRPGVVIDLGRPADGPLDLRVNGARVGRGRAIEVGDRLGFLVEELDGTRQGSKPLPGPSAS